ncbi:hypothetical protein AB0N05_37425, partial [Nocardia sp. NPDC051030]|uniref:hypothetical protein n=1 Tax=Nocardia sp. NPDC051030 TaxID=3155162 RepID=UPI003448945B
GTEGSRPMKIATDIEIASGTVDLNVLGSRIQAHIDGVQRFASEREFHAAMDEYAAVDRTLRISRSGVISR